MKILLRRKEMKKEPILFWKRLLVVTVLLSFALPLFARGSSAQPSGGGSLPDLDTSQPAEIIFYWTGTGRPRDQEMYDNFNAIARRKLNTTMKPNLLADSRGMFPLLYASGEVFDIAYAATWLNFPNLALQGAFMDIKNLAPKYAPKTYAKQSRTAISQATFNGNLYGLPSLVATYSAYGPVYRKDLAPSFDGRMETFADYERYLTIVRQNHPEIEPYGISFSSGSELDDTWMYAQGMYPISGGTNGFLWIDPTQANPRIIATYEHPRIMEFLTMMKRWNDNGLFSKTGLANNDPDKFRDGRAASIVHNIDNWDSMVRLRQQWSFGYSNFVKDLSNMPFTQDCMVISSTSRQPARALALWELIMNDEEAYNAFYYGINGVTYRIHDLGGGLRQVQNLAVGEVGQLYEPGRMWAARTPEFFLPNFGAPPDLAAIKKGFDDQIARSSNTQKFRSFVMDTAPVETEFVNLTNAVREYWWPLELAYVDINTGLAEYRRQMEIAGIERVKAELQRQLDRYIASLR
jgi:putative aldouronate transport system substrate-binding protein